MTEHLIICATDEGFCSQASALAKRLHCPCCCDTTPAPVADWRLNYSSTGLALQHIPSAVHVQVDFVKGALAHRRRFGGGRGQPLARAVGIKSGHLPRVVDATAGLGRDAFVLASLGCDVQLLERSPIIAALLEDGLQRAQQDAELGAWIGERLSLQCTDAETWLAAQTVAPEVIYLDPMYPERKKSALVKKDMRLLQHLLGHDSTEDALLETALQYAGKRVVVKRPKGAPPLNARKPSAVIQSKNTRFDLYFV